MPFDTGQFLDIFVSYNTAVFPLQIVLFVAGLCAIGLSLRGGVLASKLASGILSFMWLWMGVVYHWMFFTRINGLAFLFGALFVLQSLILFRSGVLNERLSFHGEAAGSRRFVGVALLVFALVIYPLLGLALGHRYPSTATFGLPCPTTIFTVGLVIGFSRRGPAHVLVIPLLWTIVGFSAVYYFGMWQDLGLLFAAGASIWFLAAAPVPRTDSSAKVLL